MSINPIVQLKEKSDFNSIFSEKSELSKSQIFTAEVVDIILDSSHPLYKNKFDIGLIVFYSYNGPNGTAKPINVNSYKPPLKHESVLIISSAVENTNEQPSKTGYYYIDVVDVWNILNFNPTPYSTNIQPETSSNSKSYSNFSGNSQSGETKPPEFGKYFVSKPNIPSIQPFEGDYLLQGRWGNTIRFGSIAKGKNTWSTAGDAGSPVIIISVNGKEDSELKPRAEDINIDPSSIFICEKAKIDVKKVSENAKTYSITKNKPEDQSKFLGNQILFNSDRLFFQSKTDSIFFNSKKTIHFSAKESLNLDADNDAAIKTGKSITIDSKKIIIDSETLFLKGVIKGTPRFEIGTNGVFTSFDGRVIHVINGLITGID